MFELGHKSSFEVGASHLQALDDERAMDDAPAYGHLKETYSAAAVVVDNAPPLDPFSC